MKILIWQASEPVRQMVKSLLDDLLDSLTLGR
jgi:hypothetical protein